MYVGLTLYVQTFLPVSSLWSSNSEEIWRVVYSVSAAVPAPQQLEERGRSEVMKSDRTY